MVTANCRGKKERNPKAPLSLSLSLFSVHLQQVMSLTRMLTIADAMPTHTGFAGPFLAVDNHIQGNLR